MAIEDRISVLYKDLSVRFSSQVGVRGYTVIKAPKGKNEPIFFPSKSESLIRAIYGDYSEDYPQIWDAIQYNNAYPLYIVAPSKNGKYGGVLVTTAGTIELGTGITSLDSLDFSSIAIEDEIGTGDGVNDTFSFTLTKFDYYVNQSIDILVDGVSISVTASDADPEVLTSASLTSGTYNRTTGLVSLVFDGGAIPAEGAVVTASYDIDVSNDCYFGIFNNAFQADDKAAKLELDGQIFNITLSKKETDGTYSVLNGYPKQVSIDRLVTGDFNANIFIDDIYADDYYFSFVRNTAITTVGAFADDTDWVDFSGGNRGDTLASSDIAAGYDSAKDSNAYPVNIFFDCTGGSDIITKFSSLRNDFNKYADYLYPLSSSTTAEATVVTEKQGFALDDRGLKGYWTWCLIDNPLNDSFFISSMLGAIARKYADMNVAYNGLQPAGLDEDGLGGVLSGYGVKKLLSKVLDEDTMLKNRINYLVLSPNWGLYLMIAQTSVVKTSDYTSVGHSRLADYIIKTVVEQILPLQYQKLNDEAHRSKIKSLCDSLLNPMVSQPFPVLRDFYVKCDSENNNDEVLAREEFELAIAVKFTKFSKWLKLTFINVSQNTDVKAVFE